jgi:hypothetical protein
MQQHGYDREDVEQHLLLRAYESGLATETREGYLYVSLRNELRSLMRELATEKRGAGWTNLYLDTITDGVSPRGVDYQVMPSYQKAVGSYSERIELTPEDQCVAAEELTSRLQALPDELQQRLTSEFERMARASETSTPASVLVDTLIGSIEKITMTEKAIPDCHASVDRHAGYDMREPTCWHCAAKTTCLPLTLQLRARKDEVEKIDPEVAAVQTGVLSLEQFYARVRERQRCLDEGRSITATLDHRNPVALRTQEQRKVEAKRRAKRYLRRQPRAQAVELQSGMGTLSDQFPRPQRVHQQRMEELLNRLNLRAGRVRGRLPFQIDIGMTLIYRGRQESVEIRITSNGFEWRGWYFSSLSTACCHALRRSVSGFDLFDARFRKNCIITGSGVPGGTFHY